MDVLVEKFFLFVFFDGFVVIEEFYVVFVSLEVILVCVEGGFEFLDVGDVVGFFW